MPHLPTEPTTDSAKTCTGPATPTLSLFRHYHPPRNVYDEAFVVQGEPRPQWRRFVADLNGLGHDEFARRWALSRRVVQENGIAYSAYGDPQHPPRPWDLDALPLLISGDEWSSVADGLRQRARLLELVIADLYGPRKLIIDGILPPEIVLGHPGFWRPYHDVSPAGGRYLHLYAADLARGTDGRWRVLADRSEAPSGAGFALENRVVISRMLPALFRDAKVKRLAPYFVALQETLRTLAHGHRDNPRIVLLSQGPKSPNYFEDAYLARYLGYTLVEGDDLAVRNDDIALKTLSGLLPVDVIVRRPNGEMCDPLELAAHGQMGSAGMLQAARSGSTAIVNPFGSGLVESPVFMAYLPTLCQRLLGEPLRLPGVATWWCGTPEGLDHTLRNIESLTVKQAFRQRGQASVEIKELSVLPPDQRADLIRLNPRDYVAQERIVRSSMPLWQSGSFQPSHVALRTYLVSSGDDYEVMSGGLTRTSLSTDLLELSLESGAGSKDTWILSDSPVDPVTLLPRRGDVLKLVRGTGDLPSRVADNLYWLGRHLERTDSAARLLRHIALRLASETGEADFADLPLLIRCLAEQGQIEPGYAVPEMQDQMPAIEDVLPQTVFDIHQPGSLQCILDKTLSIASNVRDRLSVDSWRIVTHLHGDFTRPAAGDLDLGDLLNLTNELIMDLAAFGGTVTESMTRTLGYRFLEIGRRLERSLQILSLLGNCFSEVSRVSRELLDSVLEIADSRMTYRSRYLANLQLATVLDMLLTDETNPRALSYQLVALHDHVLSLPQATDTPSHTDEQRLAMSILHQIRMTDIVSISDRYIAGDSSPLTMLVNALSQQLPALSNAISMRYLVHAGPSHQLSDVTRISDQHAPI